MRAIQTTLLAAVTATLATSAAAQTPAPTLEMRPCELSPGGETGRCGTYWAPENREQPDGRRIPLAVVVVPARSATPRPDPIFFFVGGPGQAATDFAAMWADAPDREHRDVVLVDQRGTSREHALHCQLSGSPDNPQGYLDPIFQPALFRRCRAELEPRADLTRYTTADYVDDVDEVRRALGYDRINVQGGSYGTRVVLFYLRQYPRHARTAYMTGLYPPTTRNPLYHAADSQAALDSIFALCAREAACSAAFPNLRAEFAETMERLRRQPARVILRDQATGAPIGLTLDADAFAEGVRVTMYGWDRARRLPLLLHRAHGGDYTAFAATALANNAALRDMLHLGLGMSTICQEDMPRITEADIVALTRNTFLGDQRVRTQRAACAEWPTRPLPAGSMDPVVSDVPALLVSGAYDPATAPRLGDETARTLRNSLHVVVPGGHIAQSPCLAGIVSDFLERGTVQGLDTSCVSQIRLAPFVVSEEEADANR
ncbi:alpha/beta hydrolase [Longimicrobium sp.]|uniref:alpha/beta hydrolase n=1 Tax=Longimicrobium sp. TaxID=2029185 RepID=UPI002E31193B|nr:alpha/beta hydrolase [Longimicrobium sp.]HEX6040860.1 alpha/beta hydrolase [Longimicrobium sp.]